MADLRDGYLNLIGAILFVICIALVLILYYRERTLTYIFFFLIMFGGFMYALGNILYKWGFSQGVLDWDAIGETFSMFLIALVFVIGFVSVLEERIKEALSKSDFYKDLLAHDLANILSIIKSSAELMEIWKYDQTKSDIKEGMMKIIIKQVERGTSLISNIQKFSKVEQGEKGTSIDVKSTLENAIEHIYSRFQEKEVNIKTNFPQGIINVEGGNLLIDAFENILLNSCIHNNNENIKLWINFYKIQKEGESFIKIEFKDNGYGISDERKRIIFEKNYEKNKNTTGMGLGLFLVKKIINAYGGQIRVKNRVEGDHKQGSNFIILLKEI